MQLKSVKEKRMCRKETEKSVEFDSQDMYKSLPMLAFTVSASVFIDF